MQLKTIDIHCLKLIASVLLALYQELYMMSFTNFGQFFTVTYVETYVCHAK